MTRSGVFTGTTWNGGSVFEVMAFAKAQDRKFRRAVLRAHPEFGPIRPTKRLRKDPGPTLAPGIAAARARGWQFVLDEVARRHSVCVNDLLDRHGSGRVRSARNELCYRLRHELQLSFPAIAKHLGGRDHTTIWNAVRVHTADLAKRKVSPTFNIKHGLPARLQDSDLTTRANQRTVDSQSTTQTDNAA